MRQIIKFCNKTEKKKLISVTKNLNCHCANLYEMKRRVKMVCIEIKEHAAIG
jgi:hypothetical protein